jgi:hypothetical protein
MPLPLHTTTYCTKTSGLALAFCTTFYEKLVVVERPWWHWQWHCELNLQVKVGWGIMSGLARSARQASAVALAILLGGLVLVSLVAERTGKAPSQASFAADEGVRRMLSRINGGLADQRTPEDDDPFSSSSKRKVPNGPDPIHNR